MNCEENGEHAINQEYASCENSEVPVVCVTVSSSHPLRLVAAKECREQEFVDLHISPVPQLQASDLIVKFAIEVILKNSIR